VGGGGVAFTFGEHPSLHPTIIKENYSLPPARKGKESVNIEFLSFLDRSFDNHPSFLGNDSIRLIDPSTKSLVNFNSIKKDIKELKISEFIILFHSTFPILYLEYVIVTYVLVNAGIH
jgi:hypothetical protein